MKKKIVEIKEEKIGDYRRHLRINEQFGIDPNRFVDSRNVEFMKPLEFEGIQYGYELVSYEHKNVRNVDMPDNREFINMGLNVPMNPWVDCEGGECAYSAGKVRHMNGAHFRELCVPMNGRLYALYLKGKKDMQPPSHLRPEKIYEWLGNLNRKNADRLTKVFRRTKANYNVVRCLMNGYHAMPDGFKKFESDEMVDAVDKLESIENALEKIPKQDENNERSIDDEREFYYDLSNRLIESGRAPFSSVMRQMDYIESMARQAVRDRFIDGTPDEEWLQWSTVEPEVDDKMNDEEELLDWREDAEIPMIDNAFGAFPLYFEDDGITTEFINEIKKADVAGIVEIQKMMFPKRDYEWGTFRKAELDFLNDKQRSVFWSFVLGRKQQLIDGILMEADIEIKEFIKKIFEISNKKVAKALINAISRGESIKINDEITIDRPVEPNTLWLLWEAFKQSSKRRKTLKF
jgi:hypothetical protein